jgi:hypothetical protein
VISPRSREQEDEISGRPANLHTGAGFTDGVPGGHPTVATEVLASKSLSCVVVSIRKFVIIVQRGGCALEKIKTS